MYGMEFKNLLQKDKYEEIMKQQSKINFKGTRKSLKNYDSHTFKQMKLL